MSDVTQIQFFLGANAAGGFVSLYDRWVDQRKLQAFYCLKGGAGCGKSTLMTQVAQAAWRRGMAWSTSSVPVTQIPWMESTFRGRGLLW